jgi:hypothetical protein
LHSKRDAAKSGIAKLLLLLQTPLLTDSAATAQPVNLSIRNVWRFNTQCVTFRYETLFAQSDSWNAEAKPAVVLEGEVFKEEVRRRVMVVSTMLTRGARE